MGDTAMVSEYTVTGMVCQHCISAVSEEVGTIPGVPDVQVDLDTGRLRITSKGPVGSAAVRAAVDEAGYEVAD